jgi:hypothetical protein
VVLTIFKTFYGRTRLSSNGFWAYKMEDELPNKGMVVTFVIRIEDVTTKVLEGTSGLSSEIEKQKKIQQNIATLSKNIPKELRGKKI